MNMHSEIYKCIRDNIIRTWPAWKRKIYNSCFAVSAHAEKLPEDDQTRSTPVWTNYDRLISKTPEALAVICSEGCPPSLYWNCTKVEIIEGESNKEFCQRCWLSWLKSPVEVDNG